MLERGRGETFFGRNRTGRAARAVELDAGAAAGSEVHWLLVRTSRWSGGGCGLLWRRLRRQGNPQPAPGGGGGGAVACDAGSAAPPSTPARQAAAPGAGRAAAPAAWRAPSPAAARWPAGSDARTRGRAVRFAAHDAPGLLAFRAQPCAASSQAPPPQVVAARRCCRPTHARRARAELRAPLLARLASRRLTGAPVNVRVQDAQDVLEARRLHEGRLRVVEGVGAGATDDKEHEQAGTYGPQLEMRRSARRRSRKRARGAARARRGEARRGEARRGEARLWGARPQHRGRPRPTITRAPALWAAPQSSPTTRTREDACKSNSPSWPAACVAGERLRAKSDHGLSDTIRSPDHSSPRPRRNPRGAPRFPR